MPHHQRPFMKGRLYINFDVEFPEPGALSPEACRALETILPPKPSQSALPINLDECEETTLQEVNIEEEMRRKEQQRQQEAYDSDDDSSSDVHRVACNQQ